VIERVIWCVSIISFCLQFLWRHSDGWIRNWNIYFIYLFIYLFIILNMCKLEEAFSCFISLSSVGMKTVRIFSDRIRDRIRLETFRSVRIRVRIFNIRYRIRIRIFKSYIYGVDIQLYLIRHDWHYPYSDPNPTTNIKTNMILVISVGIRYVLIPTHQLGSRKRESHPITGSTKHMSFSHVGPCLFFRFPAGPPQ